MSNSQLFGLIAVSMISTNSLADNDQIVKLGNYPILKSQFDEINSFVDKIYETCTKPLFEKQPIKVDNFQDQLKLKTTKSNGTEIYKNTNRIPKFELSINEKLAAGSCKITLYSRDPASEYIGDRLNQKFSEDTRFVKQSGATVVETIYKDKSSNPNIKIIPENEYFVLTSNIVGSYLVYTFPLGTFKKF